MKILILFIFSLLYVPTNQNMIMMEDDDTCYLKVCTVENGKIKKVACEEMDPPGGVECTSCTLPCPDTDIPVED